MVFGQLVLRVAKEEGILFVTGKMLLYKQLIERIF